MARIWMAAAIVACGLTAGAVSAQEFNGAEQIARGDYRAAEQLILKQQRMFAGSDLSINLAAVYARTGRQADARRLYQAVAAQPDERLDLADRRVAWSHKLAAEGLRRLDRQVAVR